MNENSTSNLPEDLFSLDGLCQPDSASMRNKLLGSTVLTILLVIGLAVTTFAIGLSLVYVPDNMFRTGSIKLNLNDGRPVIQEDEFAFEPGVTVVKPFFLQNEGTWEVYYKLYFSNVNGDLADVLDVTIQDGSTVLYSGKMSALTRRTAPVAGKRLAVGQRRDFTVTFHFPEDSGNSYQCSDLTFELCADAVQTKNNPDALFE